MSEVKSADKRLMAYGGDGILIVPPEGTVLPKADPHAIRIRRTGYQYQISVVDVDGNEELIKEVPFYP